jgi:signal transduction histidine kinase
MTSQNSDKKSEDPDDNVELVLKPLSHDLREVIRSIRYRISALSQRGLFDNSRRMQRHLYDLDLGAKNLGEVISDYRKETSSKMKSGITLTFADIVRDIDRVIVPKLGILDKISNDLSEYADQAPSLEKNAIGILRKLIERVSRRLLSIRTYAESRGQISATRFGLHNEVASVLRDLSAIIAERGAEVARPRNRIYLDADRIKIGMVLQNIIQNAVKYVPSDRVPKVQVGIDSRRAGDGPGKYLVEISIKDNGYGIRQENIEKIFEPSFRIKHAKEEPGTGIGLSIVKDVVTRHNGSILVRSDGVCGTEIQLSLPQLRDPELER